MANLRLIGNTRGAHRRRHAGRGIGVRHVAVALVVLAVVYVAVQLLRPPASPTLRSAATVSWTVPGTAPSLPWPAAGSAALSEVGVGSLGQSGSTGPVPIASIAKVLTAYVVLKDHPVAGGSQGATIAVTPDVVANYKTGLAGGQSEVAVAAGESLSEVQALEGLLVGSGNDIALLLAEWDAGTEVAFVDKMNSTARGLGMTSTHITDPSGLDPGTVASPADLLRLGQLVMTLPLVRQIVALPQVTLPAAGVVPNLDGDLGKDGIVGIKTGTDLQAKGCFLFEAEQTTAAGSATLVGVVLGQGGTSYVAAALTAADKLVKAAFASMRALPVVPPGQSLGTVVAPWGASVAVTAPGAPQIATLPGITLHGTLQRAQLASSLPAGAKVGVLHVQASAGGSIDVVLRTGAPLPGPGLTWRLTHL
jgi:D-alanyl-D-alanine carboxypeptidase (penicillin-binding protein 5/6)